MQKILIHYKSSSDLEPVYSSVAASGADLKADVKEDLILPAGDTAMVPTGIFLEIPPGYEGQVRPRSGLAARFSVTVLNTPGTIDADYRGEIKVILINLGKNDFIIKRGDRIAQLVFAPIVRAQFEKNYRIKRIRKRKRRIRINRNQRLKNCDKKVYRSIQIYRRRVSFLIFCSFPVFLFYLFRQPDTSYC